MNSSLRQSPLTLLLDHLIPLKRDSLLQMKSSYDFILAKEGEEDEVTLHLLRYLSKIMRALKHEMKELGKRNTERLTSQGE
jgi:hypothetical protein